MPGTSGIIRTAGVDAGVGQLPDRAEPLARRRRARLERAHACSSTLGTLRYTWQPACRVACDEQVGIAHDHRPLRDDGERRSRRDQRFETAPRQSVVAFDRLVGIGRGADGDVSRAPSAGRASSRRRTSGRLRLTKITRGEVVAGAELEVPLVLSRVAVLARVRAPPVRIERPLERHALRVRAIADRT